MEGITKKISKICNIIAEAYRIKYTEQSFNISLLYWQLQDNPIIVVHAAMYRYNLDSFFLTHDSRVITSTKVGRWLCFSLSLSVCLSVCNITQKLVAEF